VSTSTIPTTTHTTTPTAPTFAERLRAAHESEQRARRSRRRWLIGPRAGFAPDVAVEPRDRPRRRDEFVDALRKAG
jgi:hypothetical protein